MLGNFFALARELYLLLKKLYNKVRYSKKVAKIVFIKLVEKNG